MNSVVLVGSKSAAAQQQRCACFQRGVQGTFTKQPPRQQQSGGLQHSLPVAMAA